MRPKGRDGRRFRKLMLSQALSRWLWQMRAQHPHVDVKTARGMVVGEAKTTDGHWCIVVFYVGPGRNTPQGLFAFRAEGFDSAQRATLEMVLPFGAARGTGELCEAHGLFNPEALAPPAVESRAGAPTLGSGGDSGAFAPGLSPAPIVSFTAPALRTRRADFRHRALQWDHAPRTRIAGRFGHVDGRILRHRLRPLHGVRSTYRLVSSEPSSLFTPRRHRTFPVRLLHLCM